MRKLHLPERGDTIIEVLFAITVIAVVISGAYAISTRATKSNQLNNERNAAIKIAESQLERLRDSTSNQTLFNKVVTLSKSTTTKYCLVKTDTGDDVVVADNQNKCSVDNRYTVILTYNEADNFFTSRVEWDNDDTTPKNIELLYRVYGDSQLSLTGQAALNYAIASAKGLTQSDYSPTSWLALQTALNMPAGTLDQINAKALAISAALDGLMPAVDLSSYNSALSLVQQSNYTAASWAAYQAVVSANVVTTQNSQAQVDTATQNIKNAQASLVATAGSCSNSGTITYSGVYKIHTFSTPGAGSFVTTCDMTNVEVLLVGGGGSSADTSCVPSDWGGGAGGGYVTGTTTLAKNTYSFTVGSGGAGGGGGSNGATTTFNGYSASGGGKGVCNSGGSLSPSTGAGMTVNGAYSGGPYNGPASIGGGGAGSRGGGACGGNYYGGCPGSGGQGYVSSITGSNVTYGIGGSGGWNVGGTSGANGGGGGGGHSGRGGDGILVIRYNYTIPAAPPPTPTIAHLSVGQFTITNYSANYTYNFSSPSCTKSPSSGVVTFTATTGTCTVTASNGTLSAGKSYERTPYTYYSAPIYGYGQVGWDYPWGYCTGSGRSGNWPNGDPYCQVPVFGYGAIVGYQNVRNGTPAGWSDSGSDWYRIL